MTQISTGNGSGGRWRGLQVIGIADLGRYGSQIMDVVLRKVSLFQNFAEGAGRKRSRMHCHIGLPTTRMAKNLVASGLSDLYETGSEERSQYLTGEVRHR